MIAHFAAAIEKADNMLENDHLTGWGMAEPITLHELEKAAQNTARISEFVAARRTWKLAGGAKKALGATRDAANTFGEYLTTLMTARQIHSVETIQAPPAALAPAVLESARLEKFSDFLSQLKKWFVNHGENSFPLEGHDALRSMQASLATTIWAVESLIETVDAASPNADPDAASFGPVVKVDREARLILEDTEEMPLLQEFKGVAELTTEAKKLLDDFFAKHEIDLGAYEKRRLQDKVLRWIEGTPEGQVLVFKISGLRGRPEPYASYQQKTTKMEEV
jgi:hypothetical protein